MTTVNRTPSQPRTVDGAAPSPAAVENGVPVPAASAEATNESYRIAASLAHRSSP